MGKKRKAKVGDVIRVVALFPWSISGLTIVTGVTARYTEATLPGGRGASDFPLQDEEFEVIEDPTPLLLLFLTK